MTNELGRTVTCRLHRDDDWVESGISVCVEIIQNDLDTFGIGISYINQPAHLMGKVKLFPALGHFDMPPASGSKNKKRLRVPLRLYS